MFSCFRLPSQPLQFAINLVCAVSTLMASQQGNRLLSYSCSLRMQPITRVLGNMSITTDQRGGVIPVIDQLFGVRNQSLAFEKRREPATTLLGNYTQAGQVNLPLAWGSPTGGCLFISLNIMGRYTARWQSSQIIACFELVPVLQDLTCSFWSLCDGKKDGMSRVEIDCGLAK